MSDLENFLEQDETETAEVEAATVETETVVTEPEAPTAPEETEPPEAPDTIAMSAYMGLKSENKELKAAIDNLQRSFNQQQPQTEQAPDFWENPEEALARERRINKMTASESAARWVKPDYQDKRAHFDQMIAANPMLDAQAMAALDDPRVDFAQFVYDTASQDLELRQHGGIDEMIAAKVAEVEKKLREEYESKHDVSPSMVGVRSSAAPSAGDDFATLDDILNG